LGPAVKDALALSNRVGTLRNAAIVEGRYGLEHDRTPAVINYGWAALLTRYNTRYRGDDDLKNRPHALSQIQVTALLLDQIYRLRSIVARCAAKTQTAPSIHRS